MVTDRQIRRSKTIQQSTGPTFHLATRLLPERVRHPTYVLYAFFRIADEVVDDADAQDLDPAVQAERLEDLREQALGRTDPEGPVLAAFQELTSEYAIPDEEISTFVDAMQADVEKTRYRTHEELEAYMRGSAAAVGAMLTAIMEPADRERAMPRAFALAEAFQLTNFLRDVREDVLERGRIYVPLETLSDHGVTEDQIERLEFDEDVAAAVASELKRAERRYWTGVAGIEHLPRDCQFAVLLAAVLYAEHHRLIRERGHDVLSGTPSLGTARMTWLLAKTRWHWAWNDDPTAVFRAVSAVPDGSEARPEIAGDLEPVSTR
jgi:phytoene synthase